MHIGTLLHPSGYIHRHDLLERRWSADAILAAVRGEGLLVLRRQWIIRPDAPAPIRIAAVAGGRVTCITAARALGIWVREPDPLPHIALAPHASDGCRDAHVHRRIGVTASDPRLLIDPIENVLALAARCMDEVDALATWESAVRKGFLTLEHLRAVDWRSPLLRRLAAEVGILSDSGLETYFVGRLRRIGIVVRQQAVVGGRPVDGLIGSRLVIQIDGFEHHQDRRQRRADIAHDRTLRLLGHTVLRYAYEDVMFDWPRVEAEIRAAIALGLHLAR